MKKLMLVFIFVLAFCTTAMADIAISTQAGWMGQGHADTEAQEIVANVTKVPVALFTSAQHAALATWVADHTNNGQPDLLIMFGIFPDSIYPAGNAQPEGSLAELFLDAGNVIINTGDYIFYVGSAGNNDAGGLQNMMDVGAAEMWGDDTFATMFTPTADGTLYTPSLPTLPSNRPWFLDDFTGTDWEAELILAQNGIQAHPAILHNTVTDGRLGVFFQCSLNTDIQPRGEVISEWINNWYLEYIADLTKARQPDPAHRAIDVPVDVNLVWVRGDGAVQDDVYFGTDAGALPKVTTILNLPPFPPRWDPPGDLVAGTTYYWRIDEVNGINIVTGHLWSFTTVRGEARCDYPYDGAIIPGDKITYLGQDYIWTKLVFIPGATAAKHTGYFNEDYSKVESRAQDANLGPPPYASIPGWKYTYFAGNPQVAPADYTLVRGNRYYWTVDAEDAQGNIFGGDIWEFAIKGFYAFAPNPPNEAILISVTPFLRWLPGFGVETHEIYMGTSWEDVNNAVYDYMAPPPEFVISRSEPNFQVVTALPYSTKIYWRVDEVQGRVPPFFIASELYKGDVWCFTTIPYFPITDPNLVGWWKFDMGVGTTAWDSSGHDNHGTLMGNPQWVTGGMIDGAMDFDGQDDYVDLASTQNWPAGTSARSMCGWGKTDTIAAGWRWIAAYGSPATSQAMFIGLNGDDLYGGGYGDDVLLNDFWDVGVWHHICLTYDGTTAILYADGIEVASAAKTWNLVLSRAHIGRQVNDAVEFWNGQIDDVQIYDYALSEAEIRMLGAPPEAWLPSPYDGESGVVSPVTLNWMPGKYAALHDVYFGTDKTTVTNATTSTPGIYKGRIGPNSLGPILLDTGKLYYWRVDEVNLAGPDPCLWKGDTWFFRAEGGAGGLTGLYYHWDGLLPNNPLGPDNAFQIFVMSRIDPEVNFGWGEGSPDPNVSINDFGARWVGHVECPVDANYTFYTTTDDGARLFIDGQQLKLVDPANPTNDSWRQQGDTEYGASVVLSAGLHDIEMHMYEHEGGATARLAWSAIPTNPSDDAIVKQIIPPIWLWPPLFASGPRPPDGATIDDRTPELRWMPGLYADYHELYFSASFNDVNNRTATKQILGDPCRPFVGPRLELGKTYYWLVDEVQASPPDRWNARTVWSFTISECLSLDNMELYNDRNDIRVVWRDGSADVVWGGTYPYWTLVQGGSSGSNLNVSTAVGSPFNGVSGPIPPTPLNYQAMVLLYDNDGFTYIGLPGEEKWLYDAPYYSEIEANTVGENSLDVGQTWDSEGVKSLSMSFQGHPISDGYYDATLWPAYTVYGRGRDIWGRHDEFYFLSQYPFVGAGSVQVQVLSVDNTDPWAKAGIMIREKWTPYSKFAAVFITPGQGVTFNYRDVEDGPCTSITKPGVIAPQYVKLERTISGAFEAKHSANGFVWEDVNAPGQAPILPQIDMGDIADPNIYIGTAVTSHNANQICAADFNNVVISPLPPNWVYGNIGTNDAEQLYVALSDGVNTDVVEHNDVNAATLTTWQEWNIPLTDFTTVNLDSIKKVYIGLGDRDVPVQGGSGAIYVDDIRGCPPRCIPSLVKPFYDLAQPYDCIVNELDLALVGIDWLLGDRVITTSAPSDVNLAARYEFEGNYNDSSVHGRHAADPCGTNPGFAAGVSGAQALSLDGVEDHLVVNGVGIDGNTPRTIAVWAKANVPSTSISDWTNVFGFTNSLTSGQGGRSFDIEIVGTTTSPGSTTSGYFGIHAYQWEYDIVANDEDWHHLAATYDGTTIRWYGDGVELGSMDWELNTLDNVQIGKRGDNANNFPGLVDDARIYSVALSESEIAYLATQGAATLHVPIQSIADVYQGEAPGSQWINFNDYALIADKYLEQVLWPTP